MVKRKILTFFKIILILIVILFVICIIGVLSSKPTQNNSTNKDTVSNAKKEPVTGIEVEKENAPAEDFFYTLTDVTIILESCNTHKSTLVIYPTYTVDGKEYKTDLSQFQVGIGDNSVDTLIISEGITEVKTSIFNSCDVQRVYFPKSITNVYDYTLSYLHPKGKGGKIEIYYGGTQDEWLNIFTEYKRTRVEDAEFGSEMGDALADKANELLGSKYDSSLFDYYFNADLNDLLK
jgi:hypothetical protein